MVSAREYMSCGSRPSRRAIQSTFSPAFTLVELLVSLVIISILASLSLAGLAAVRTRGKADKTRSTIRKLHEIIMPLYESYLDRRVPGADALERLKNIRTLMMFEMPDAWEDVGTSGGILFCQTAPVLAYANVKSSTANVAEKRGPAETLYLIVSRSGVDPEALEQFRADEIGDLDGDKVLEFLDGWGQPIIFLRWAPGFLPPYSGAQTGDAANDHDPFDPNKKDAAGYRLTPLIVSGGPDERTGLQTQNAGWTPLLTSNGLASIVAGAGNIGAPVTDAANTNDFQDNITNHDLNAR